MAPRVTLHAPATPNSTSGPSSFLEHRHQVLHTNGKSADMDEADELSDMEDDNSAEEVDELDESDDDVKEAHPHWETIASAPGTAKPVVKKPRPKPPTTRIPGQTIVPMSRIEAILSADVTENGTPTKEASFIISLATEEFIRRLTRVAHSRASLDKRSLTTYNDIADSAFYFEEYSFLQDMIPRPLSPKAALEERKRILESQEALLHGVGVQGANSNNCRPAQASPSASTSNASTPIPRLLVTPSTSTNGKPPSKAKSSAANTSPPVIRSERQKLKRARMASEASQAAGEPSTSGRMAPPPSPAAPTEKGSKSEGVVVNGSSNSVKNSGMKIKIRPRIGHTPSLGVPSNSESPPPFLTLGPPTKSPIPIKREVHPIRRSESSSSRHSTEDASKPLVFEEDAKSGAKNPHASGKGGSVQFAPVGVEASDQPLWTRVPLPPPPSAKVAKNQSLNESSKNRPPMTGLDSVVDQARTSKASRARTAHERESVHSSQQAELKPVGNEDPPTKRSRQRQRSGESASSKGSLRDSLNGGFPNTGRTIYSQR